jgi:hypothetical protein
LTGDSLSHMTILVMVASLCRALVQFACAGLLASSALAQKSPVFLEVPDNQFVMFGTRNPPPGTQNFWTLNCPTEGPSGGCFFQWDIGGNLGGAVGTCSGIFHKKDDPKSVSRHCDANFDETTTITSTKGLRFVISDTGVPSDKTLGAGVLSLDEKGNVRSIEQIPQRVVLISLGAMFLVTWWVIILLIWQTLRLRRRA